MTVSLGIKDRASGAYEVVPIATNADFAERWLPACAALGLDFVSHFHDGALTSVRPEDLPVIVEELTRLRTWVVGHGSAHWLQRIDGILRPLRTRDPMTYEFDFG
jgi:hypothetical protein